MIIISTLLHVFSLESYGDSSTYIYRVKFMKRASFAYVHFLSVYKRSNCRLLSPINYITNLSRMKSPTISSSCSIRPCYSREYPMASQVLHNPHCLQGSSSRKFHQFDGSNQCTIVNCLGLDCRTSRLKETKSNAWCSMLGGQEISTVLGSWTCTQVDFHRQGIC